jgi:hypothetical protein
MVKMPATQGLSLKGGTNANPYKLMLLMLQNQVDMTVLV